jgi:tetratricopeptide (TPR) repeat protein
MGSIRSLFINSRFSKFFTMKGIKPRRTRGNTEEEVKGILKLRETLCPPWLIKSRVKYKKFLVAAGLLFFVSFSLFAQSAVPLATELSRLERLSTTASTRERYDAYMALTQLHRLSGNPEAALNACEGALALFPRDGKALQEQARLSISLGEYEKASTAAAGLLGLEQEKEFFLAGRYLGAQAEAFLSGNAMALAVLMNEPDFSDYLGSIYYTIWRLSDLPSYRNLLTLELPLSPEAAIAGGKVLPAATPLWLLFPGRESIALSPGQAVPVTPAAQAPIPQPPVSQARVSYASVLQTGLFSRPENAQTQADSLKKAGFAPEILPRQVNGNSYWAVCVPYGNDMSSMIGRLKDAGFESFPINL